MPNSDIHTVNMSCLEVWGGNASIERDIVMQGLDAWIISNVQGQGTRGGDVYYVSSCATGRIIRLLIADVSGHGEIVAEWGDLLRWLMRRYINQINQNRFVQAINMAFAERSRRGLFATAVIATYFAPTRILTLSNAGHPPPAFYQASSASWSFLASESSIENGPSDIPLGISPDTSYEVHERRLCTGDIVVCYTDALLECRNEEGERLGPNGLMLILQQLDTGMPSQLVSTLMQTLQGMFVGNLGQDDATVLLFTPNSLFDHAYQAPTLRSHLAVMKKFVQAMFSKDEPIPWPDLHPANMGGAMFSVLNKLWGRKLK